MCACLWNPQHIPGKWYPTLLACLLWWEHIWTSFLPSSVCLHWSKTFSRRERVHTLSQWRRAFLSRISNPVSVELINRSLETSPSGYTTSVSVIFGKGKALSQAMDEICKSRNLTRAVFSACCLLIAELFWPPSLWRIWETPLWEQQNGLELKSSSSFTVTSYIFLHTLLAVMESLPHRKRSVQIIRQSLSVMYVYKLWSFKNVILDWHPASLKAGADSLALGEFQSIIKV